MEKMVELIKIACDLFEDEKMMIISDMPEGYGIIVVWFKLLCLAGKRKKHGALMLNEKVAYTDQMLASLFKMPFELVKKALDVFDGFGMTETEDGVIRISNWDKYQSVRKEVKEEEEPKKKYSRAEYPDDFVKFWEKYPRKDDKGAAYKEYIARIRSGFTPEELFEAEQNYINRLKKDRTELKYTKMAKTFLGSTLYFEQYINKEKKPVKENPFEDYVL